MQPFGDGGEGLGQGGEGPVSRKEGEGAAGVVLRMIFIGTIFILSFNNVTFLSLTISFSILYILRSIPSPLSAWRRSPSARREEGNSADIICIQRRSPFLFPQIPKFN